MRVMSRNLPAGVKISRDAKECMCQIATEMTGFVTMEASAIAKVNAIANGTSRVSKAAVGLDECVRAFPQLGLDAFLPTIQHWIQATHAARMASRRRHRAQLLKQAAAAQGGAAAKAAAAALAAADAEEHEGDNDGDEELLEADDDEDEGEDNADEDAEADEGEAED